MKRDEARLIRRLKRRDEAAFALLVRTYQDRVFGHVYRMLGDREEAEDLAQEVFVSVFKAIDRFRGDSSLSTWIYRIATNHCKNRIKYLRRRHHGRAKDIDETRELEFHPTVGRRHARPESAAIGNELERLVQSALAELDDDHREIILLRDVEHLAYDEIAAVLGVAKGTVKSRLFRARLALKEKLAGRYDGSAHGANGGDDE